MANELKTYGDLKKAIQSISLKQKGEKLAGVGVDVVIGLIPGAEAAKTTFDFIKAAVTKPDSKKTKTWLDKLDIDDDMSKIIDDTVENGFIQTMAKIIEKESDSKPLEQDFNMNQKLVDYLKDNYQGRTVTGIKENKMKKSQLHQLIREEIQNILEEDKYLNEVASSNTPKLQGSQLNLALFKELAPNINPQFLTNTINLVKQNKTLNNAANKTLAELMIAMIKTSDDNLLNKIFQNLKQMEVK
jgi:hypothetical protein